MGIRAIPFTERTTAETELHSLPIAPRVDYAMALDLGNGRRLYHSDRDLIYADGDQFYPIVVRGFPHLVGKSPDGSAVAFLDPFEFEQSADLFVFDIPARSLRRLTELGDNPTTSTVKSAQWYDDRTIYYLQGYRYGTVTRGGDLWKVDVRSAERRQVLQLVAKGKERLEEVVEFRFVPESKSIQYVVMHYDESSSPTRKSYSCTLEGKPAP